MFLLSVFSAASLLLLLYSALGRDPYTRTFTYLAVIFTIFFYILPLSYAAADGGLPLGSIYVKLDGDDIRFASFALLAFSAGFAIAGLALKDSPSTPAKLQRERNTGNRPIVESLLAMTLIGVAIYAFNTGLYQQTYAIRREEAEGSYLLSTFLISTYYVGCFYILRALNQNRLLKSTFWTILCILVAINFVGRTNLLLLFSLPFMHYVRRPELSFLLIIFSAALFLPAVAHGKEIVYALMTGENMGGVLSNVYAREYDIRGIVGNLSHIVISLVCAPDLVEKFGGFRFFWDIPHGVLFYFRLIGLDMGASLTYYNTEIIFGIRESVIPIGYLGFGYVQAGMIGVFLSGAIYRCVGHLLGKVYRTVAGASFASIFFFAFLAANSFYIGEPRALVLTLVFPVVVILWIRFVGQRRFGAYRAAT